MASRAEVRKEIWYFDCGSSVVGIVLSLGKQAIGAKLLLRVSGIIARPKVWKVVTQVVGGDCHKGAFRVCMSSGRFEAHRRVE